MTSQGTLFEPPPPPDCDEEAAVMLLKAAFARALIEAGTATLSDARRHLRDSRVVDCIRPKRFGSIPGELGDSIEAVDIARPSHTCGRSHFLLRYRPKDRGRLAAIAGGGGV